MSPSPPGQDRERVRSELEARRDRTREQIAALARRPELGSAQGFGKRIGDGTVEAISRLTEIGVGESLEAALLRLERALAKLDDGSYGLCDVCGEPIAPARLQARPDSVLCISCAGSAPRSRPPRRR
jgi:DnaK suppressor protein